MNQRKMLIAGGVAACAAAALLIGIVAHHTSGKNKLAGGSSGAQEADAGERAKQTTQEAQQTESKAGSGATPGATPLGGIKGKGGPTKPAQPANTEEYVAPSGSRIVLVDQDIVTFKGDAIVNAGNPSLGDGSGVCGCIWKAATGGDAATASSLRDELKKFKPNNEPVAVGSAHTSGAYKLSAVRWIIHAVGPNCSTAPYDKDLPAAIQALHSAYSNSLREAFVEHDAKTIMIPPISTGIFKFPLQDAAVVAVKACKEFLDGIDPSRKLTIYLTYYLSEDKLKDALRAEIQKLRDA